MVGITRSKAFFSAKNIRSPCYAAVSRDGFQVFVYTFSSLAYGWRVPVAGLWKRLPACMTRLPTCSWRYTLTWRHVRDATFLSSGHKCPHVRAFFMLRSRFSVCKCQRPLENPTPFHATYVFSCNNLQHVRHQRIHRKKRFKNGNIKFIWTFNTK